MREIKFRAWNKDKRRMFDVFGLDPNHVIPWRVGEYLDCPHREDVVLMQYTGLKDKHGKEIYQGDIIKFISLDGGNPTIITWVIFENGAFRDFYYGEPLSSHIDMQHCGNPFSVIGNIYENPELLED